MIDDIVFSVDEFILEIPFGSIGGVIVSYSMDGYNYDFTESSGGGETSSIFIN
jgi:hypothetical protein